MRAIRTTFVILTAFLFSLSVFGQGAPAPILGAKGGINLSSVGGDTDSKVKFVPHLGAYSEIFFDYFLMLQIEALLSFQGHGELTTSGNKLNLTYLNFPVLARYNLGYNFNVHVGLQFGFLLSAKSEFQGNKTDVKSQFKSVDLGIPIGLGYEFMDRKFNATLRYIIGVNNIADFPGTRRNNVFQFSVGMLLTRLGT